MKLIWLPGLAVVAAFGVRAIGVRVGWWRATLIAGLGIATAGVALNALNSKRDEHPVLLIVTFGLFAVMSWAAILELGSRASPGQRRHREKDPRRALPETLKRGARKAQIALIVTRFGLGRYAHRNADRPRGPATGRALRETLERAGGVYVKLGQFLSTRSDLLPIEITAELHQLQQHAAPVPLAAIHRVVAAELGGIDQSFAAFNAEPVAAASLAQVHEAILKDGRRVAVKIRRPGIAVQVHRDLDILMRLAERLERRTQWAFEMQVMETAEGFAKTVIGELDFEAEAQNLRLMANVLQKHPRFVVPEPIAHLTRTRLLVMEWVDGVPLSHAAESLSIHERSDLARALLGCFLDQILVVGVFHADPHPGNLFLTADRRIALIDCGSIGMLDRRQRSALQAVLAATGAQDPEQLRAALRPITTTGKSINEPLLKRRLGDVLVHHLGSGMTPGAAFLTALMEIMQEFGLALDPAVGGALRALAELQSTLESLDQSFDLLGEAKSYGHSLVHALWTPTHPGSPREALEAALPSLIPALVTLPRRLDRIIESVERNDISVGIHLSSDQDRRFIAQLIAPVITTIVPAAFGLIGALLILGAKGGGHTTESDRILQAVGVGCVSLSFLFLFSALVAALRQRRERL